jgi:hypothetical protein
VWRQLKELRAEAVKVTKRLRASCPLELDELEFRFWSKVAIVDDDDSCWEWTRTRGPAPDHYGKFRWVNPGTRKSEVVAASVVALFLTTGAVPDHACHTCDNPPCCRPKHLYDGTHADNMKDKSERGRSRTRRQDGELNAQAKLTDDLVIMARGKARTGLLLREIHDLLGKPCNETVLRWAITGRTWRHLNATCPPVIKRQRP